MTKTEQREVKKALSMLYIDARYAAVKADRAAHRVKTDRDCTRCAGRGYLPQFQHHKGGECFACGATGVAS